MTQFTNCNTKAPDHNKADSLVFRHLMDDQTLLPLDSGERQRLDSVRWLVKTIDRNCPVIGQGEDREVVAVLLSGWAFCYQTLPDGKRQILDFIFAGALVGFGTGLTNSYGVETVTACNVATLPHGQFRRLLATCPALAMQVVERVSDSEMRAHEHMTSLGRRSARERVAALIVELTCRAQCTDLGRREYSIDLPVTQMMIGDALGLSNEHVCRILGKLANDKVIEINNHTLKVLDQPALSREAGADPKDFIGRESQLPAAA
ncbi:MAG: Crp/Fnr family transcriptional regulator [Aestuariivirga sp.]|nr:Crp/Fnr family transcriptional regulator [Aestuariivirga sp.]